MTRATLALLLVFVSQAYAQDTSYRQSIEAAKQRLSALEEQQRHRELTPAEQKERFAALGELMETDPVWALHREVIADAAAFSSGNPLRPQDRTTLEELKQFVLLTGQIEQRATTPAEAKAFAWILREFIVRHDLKGATAWANAQ